MFSEERLTDIQIMLRDSLGKVLERHYGFEQREKFRKTDVGYSPEAWSAYAELGLLSLGVDEDEGGAGGDLSDLGLICQQLGAALTLEPFISTVVFGSRLLARHGTTSQKAQWLGNVLSGATAVALAHGEGQNRYNIGNVEAVARRTEQGFVLDGAKRVSEGADVAGLFVVSARIEGEAGLGLFLVSSSAQGVDRRCYRTFDGQGAADLTFAKVELGRDSLLADAHEAETILARAIDEATLLHCADAVGAMRAANSLTFEYANVRKQFGVTIGSFQALQHRMVDMAVAGEMANAITAAALSSIDASDASRSRAVSAAKVRVGESARMIGQQVIQLHGGMGLTQEYPASHYFARLGQFERRWGDADHHLNRYAKLMEAA